MKKKEKFWSKIKKEKLLKTFEKMLLIFGRKVFIPNSDSDLSYFAETNVFGQKILNVRLFLNKKLQILCALKSLVNMISVVPN